MDEIENIALFDLDGTLCDYDKALLNDLNCLRGPKERMIRQYNDHCPQYIHNRADLIRASEEWWINLPKFQLGWDALQAAQAYHFRIMICTAGPKKNPAAWSGKKKWIDNHLGDQTDITITRDKGLVYGKILVDDYPKYILKWLEWRKRGIVIMPDGPMNQGFKHKQVIRYNGSIVSRERMWEAFEITSKRKPRQP